MLQRRDLIGDQREDYRHVISIRRRYFALGSFAFPYYVCARINRRSAFYVQLCTTLEVQVFSIYDASDLEKDSNRASSSSSR